ncbi:MAG: hypothetical protein VYB24_07900, partial [Pseudomonadota bacterium]|nr:hypothetical protein [Pseudomonadota bacterium]
MRTYARTAAASDRFDRWSIESIGSVDLVILRIFRFFGAVGELEICLVSKFQLCTTLGGRKTAEKPKWKNLDFCRGRFDRFDNEFDSIDHGALGPRWTALSYLCKS